MQDSESEIVSDVQNGIVWVFIIMMGLILPALLIPIVRFTGYSEIVEEVAKGLIVLLLILKLPSRNAQIFAGIVFGFLFGLSESVFYLTNIFQVGNFGIFWQRFLWTVPMHITTVLLMVVASFVSRRFLIFGFVVAVVLHLLFNSLIINFLI